MNSTCSILVFVPHLLFQNASQLKHNAKINRQQMTRITSLSDLCMVLWSVGAVESIYIYLLGHCDYFNTLGVVTFVFTKLYVINGYIYFLINDCQIIFEMS